MAEILATLDDINAELPADDDSPVTVADEENTSLLQISVARVVRGYLSRVIDNGTLQTWTVPENTPELISTIAGKLIASQLYFNQVAKTTHTIEKDSFAQKLYDDAIALLNQVITGDIVLPEVLIIDQTENLSNLDYFPIDATNRAFTLGQQF